MANMNLDKVNARIFVNGYLIEDDSIDLYTINMSTGCISGNFIGYGATYSPSCEITMSETDMFNIGDRVKVQFYLDGEWVDFGSYVLVDEPVTEEGTKTIRLEGHLSTTFESEMVSFTGDQLFYGIKILDAIDLISTQTGVIVNLYGYDDIYQKIVNTVIDIPSYDASTNEIKAIRISCREFVAGLSLLLGGNVIERNGQVYITSLGSLYDFTTVFTEDDYSTLKISKKSYTPDSVILSYQPYIGRGDGNLVYTPGDKLKKEMVRNHVSNEIPYTINVECDWIGFNARNGFLTQSSFGYNPAEVEFPGYHPSLYAGNQVRVSDGDNKYYIMCGIVEYEWDGGLTTKVSSVFSAENNQANTSISTSSNVATYSQIIAQLNDVMTFKGIYTDFVDTKAVTTDTLSAKVAEIDSLKADSAIIKNIFSESIISDKAILDVLQAKVVDANVVKAAVADVGYLTADEANLAYATINSLEAEKARISILESDNATINGKLSVIEVEVEGKLNANELSAEVAKLGYATIENLNATNAKIEDLDVNKLSVADAKVQYAEIDLSNVGTQVVSTSMIKDGAVTNEKVGNLSANKITSGTIDASKITVTNLNADNLTVGTINGKLIGNGSVDLNKLSQEVPTKEYLDNVQKELQGQIDGAIETFTKSEIPTLNNEPANTWTDNETRKKHIGDVCYVLNPASSANGYCYRFANTGTESSTSYEWVLIKDSDVTKALQDIIDINGEITGIKQFDTEISSWKTDTDAELSSIKSRTTMLETDIGSKVESSVFNKLKQTVDENSSSITSLSTTVGKKADSSTVETLTNTVNSVKQTADTNTSSISSMQTTISNKADSSTVTALSNKTSELEQNLDGFKTTVSETYTTKTEFNNLEIGGRNLFLGTALNNPSLVANNSTDWTKPVRYYNGNASMHSFSEYADGVYVDEITMDSAVANYGIAFARKAESIMNVGDTYTISVWAKCTSTARSFYIGLSYYTTDGNWIWRGGANQTAIKKANEWQKFTLTFKLTDTNVNYICYTVGFASNSGTACTGYIRQPKLEKGNKATDWTPAPEDTEEKITELNTKYTEVKQTADGLSTTVASHTTQLANAETKIAYNETVATQTAEKFNWIVKSGTSATDFTLTDRVASLLSEQFNIDALTTFKNSAENGTSTVINGGAIKAKTIKAESIDVDSIFAQNISAKGTITGGSFVGSSFEGATGSFTGEITSSSGKIGFLNVGSTFMRSGDSEADSEFYMTSSYLGIAKYIDGMRAEYTLIEPTGIYTSGDVIGGGTSLSYEHENSVRSTILNIGDITINSNSPFGMNIANQVDDHQTILGVCLLNCWPHSTWAFACTALLSGSNLYISTTTTQVYTVSVLIFYKDV